MTNTYLVQEDSIQREATPEEVAQIEQDLAASQAAQAEAQAKADAKASALAKLAALGLTEEEIAAL